MRKYAWPPYLCKTLARFARTREKSLKWQNLSFSCSNYNPDPRNNRIAAGSIYAPDPPRLPRPQALVAENKPRLARKNSELQEEESPVNRVGEAKSADAGLGDFLGGLKLPELPELPLPKLPEFPTLPSLFGGSKESGAKAKSDNGQAIPVSVGVKPETDVSLLEFSQDFDLISK